MQTFYALSTRQLLIVWMIAIVAGCASVLASRVLTQRSMRESIGPSVRYSIIENERAHEIDSLAQLFANQHPDDVKAQIAARSARSRADSTRASAAKAERMLARGAIDTSYANVRTTRSHAWRSVVQEGIGLILLLVLPVGMTVLAVLTVLRFIDRARRRPSTRVVR